MSRHRQEGPPSTGLVRRCAVIVMGVLLLSWGGPAASAFWSSVASNFGAAAADTVGQGATPSTSVSGSTVSVAWEAGTTAAGRSVTGYSIARYSAASGGTAIAAGGTCSGTVAGLGCSETVPSGTWYYTVTPLLSSWKGAESNRGAAAAIDSTPPAAPAITAPTYVNQANVGNVPVSGTAEAGSTVVLTVTDSGTQSSSQTLTANAAGAWTAAPLNLTAFNAGTITYSARATDAAGNTGAAGTATSTKDVITPAVGSVRLNNGGATAGKVERGNSVTITFSEPLNPATICSAWTNGPGIQTQNGTGNKQVVVNISATDVLTVTGAGCPTLRVGSVALGADYTSVPLTFMGNNTNASSLQWNHDQRTLTITLGAGTAGAATITSTTVSPSYTPAAGVTDAAGNALPTTQTAGLASRF